MSQPPWPGGREALRPAFVGRNPSQGFSRLARRAPGHVAADIGVRLQACRFLVLDAFLAVGPVFRTAVAFNGRLHLLTRGKKNVAAYQRPPPLRPHQRGPRRVYGKKLKLFNPFDSRVGGSRSVKALVDQQKETVRYLVLG